jgi:steroid delta-isomerase-like uncharacterized protein
MAPHPTQPFADRFDKYETAWNQGDIGAFDQFFAEDVIVHIIPEQTNYEGLDAFMQWAREARTAFPDLAVTTTSVIVGTDRVASQWEASGTHDGAMTTPAIAPTGNSATWEGVTVYEIDDGSATEIWMYYDMIGLLTQLGVVSDGPPA